MLCTRSARQLAFRQVPSRAKDKRNSQQSTPTFPYPLLAFASLAIVANEAQCSANNDSPRHARQHPALKDQRPQTPALLRPPATHRWLDAVKRRDSPRSRLQTLQEETRIVNAPNICDCISICASQGNRSSMEDTVFVSPQGEFSSVFDGHGGHEVAQYLSERLYEEFQARVRTSGNYLGVKGAGTDVIQSLADAIGAVDTQIQAVPRLDFMGATATVVLLHNSKIIVANVGDSRAVLCRQGSPLQLTRDHKPDDPEERRRIQERGGVVSWCSDDVTDSTSLTFGDYRVNGNLSMSRAIGDAEEKPYVSGEPEIGAYSRDFFNDEFIVVASDGLWDVMTNKEVCDFVRGRLEEPSASGSDTIRGTMASALARQAQLLGSDDNVSVILVWLK